MPPGVKKTYYSIGEVSALTDLKPHVLRYWETQFDIVSPAKNRGTRVYTRPDIEAVLLVRHMLYERRLTIAGAKREFQVMRQDKKVAETAKRNARPAMLASVREGLLQLREDLTAPDGSGKTS